MKSRWAPVSSLTHSARTVGFTTQSTTMLAVPLLSAQPRGGPMLTGTLTPSTSLPSLSRRFVGLGAPTAAAEHTLTKYFCGAPAPASRMPPPSGAFCVPVVLSTKPGVGTMRMPSSVAGRVAPPAPSTRPPGSSSSSPARAGRDTRSGAPAGACALPCLAFSQSSPTLSSAPSPLSAACMSSAKASGSRACSSDSSSMAALASCGSMPGGWPAMADAAANGVAAAASCGSGGDAAAAAPPSMISDDRAGASPNSADDVVRRFGFGIGARFCNLWLLVR